MSETILRTPQLTELLGVHRTTLWRWEQAGAFPLRRSFGPNTVGWYESEIMEWVKGRPVADSASMSVEGR